MESTLEGEGAAQTARRVVARCCADARLDPDCSNSAVLMTSELVTNAMLHGRGPVRLGVEADGRMVRIEVSDGEPRHPELPDWDDNSEGGRGLLIVDALATSWGITDKVSGKYVWFEIVCQP